MRLLTVFLVISLAGLGACDPLAPCVDDLDTRFSSEIQRIVPQALLDTLRRRGMTINEGLNPPNLEGIYLITPNLLLSPYGPEDPYKKGFKFIDQKFRFYEQDSKTLTIKLEYKSTDNPPTGYASGLGAYLSGSGNLFTAFIETTGTTNGIPNKEVAVYSGEITPTGIRGWKNAFIMKEKTGDTSNKLIPIGAGRIVEDGDGLAERVSSYRFAASFEPLPGPVRDTSVSVLSNHP